MKNNLSTTVINMRPGFKGIYPYRAMRAVRPIANAPWQHISTHHHGDRLITDIFANNRHLGARTYTDGTEAPEPYLVADRLPYPVTGSIPLPDGFLILTTGNTYHAVWDDTGLMLRIKDKLEKDDYPQYTLCAVSSSSVTTSLGPVRLAGTYSVTDTEPSITDRLAIRTELSRAYAELVNNATNSGLFTAPVLVRLRYYGTDGQLLFVTAPKLHVPPGRRELPATIGMPLDSRSALPASLSLESYMIDATLPGDNLRKYRSIGRIEIQLTPQLHNLDMRDVIAVSLLHKDIGTVLSAQTPGFGGTASRHDLLVSYITNALTRLDDIFTTSVEIINPFMSSTGRPDFRIKPLPLTYSQECSLIRRYLTSPATDTDRLSMVSHSVSAATGLADSGRLILGDLHLRLFCGHPLRYFINYRASLECLDTVVTVDFNDGRRVVCRDNNFYCHNFTLSPLLLYPHPDACRITFQAESTGGSRHFYCSFPLSPSPCGGYSYYIDPDLRPLSMLSSDSDEIPEYNIYPAINPQVRYPDMLMSVDMSSSAAAPASLRRVGHGEITSIHHVSRPSSSAWESSRSRFDIFTTSGTYAVSINGGLLTAPRALDSRPVLRPDAVVSIPSDSGNTLYAYAGGDIVKVENDRVCTIRSDLDGDFLAAVPEYGELYLIPADAAPDTLTLAHVLHTRAGNLYTRRHLPPVDSASRDGTGRYLTSTADGAVYDLWEETADGLTRCVFICEIEQKIRHPGTGVPRLRYITVNLLGSTVDGTVSITGSHGPDTGRVLTQLHVRGPLLRPLCHHTLMPARNRLWVTVDALLSPDATYIPPL